jgi:hypothetical protein
MFQRLLTPMQQNKLNFEELPYDTNVQPFPILEIFATLFN